MLLHKYVKGVGANLHAKWVHGTVIYKQQVLISYKYMQVRGGRYSENFICTKGNGSSDLNFGSG